VKFHKPGAAPPVAFPLLSSDWKTPEDSKKFDVPASIRLRAREPDTQEDVAVLLRGPSAAAVNAMTTEEPYTGEKRGPGRASAAAHRDQAAAQSAAESASAQAHSASSASDIDELLSPLLTEEERAGILEHAQILTHSRWSKTITDVAEQSFQHAEVFNPLDIDWESMNNVNIMRAVMSKLAPRLHAVDPVATLAILAAVPGLQEALTPAPIIITQAPPEPTHSFNPPSHMEAVPPLEAPSVPSPVAMPEQLHMAPDAFEPGVGEQSEVFEAAMEEDQGAFDADVLLDPIEAPSGNIPAMSAPADEIGFPEGVDAFQPEDDAMAGGYDEAAPEEQGQGPNQDEAEQQQGEATPFEGQAEAEQPEEPATGETAEL
jgi:hypothetical protein